MLDQLAPIGSIATVTPAPIPMVAPYCVKPTPLTAPTHGVRGETNTPRPASLCHEHAPPPSIPLPSGTRVRTSNTRPATRLLTPTLDRTAEHHFRTSGTRSTAPCTGRSRDRRFPLAEMGEYPRSHSRLHPHSHYPGFSSPSCPVPMRRVSSRPGSAAGGARFPGSPCDMTETAERHDPGGAIQSLRGRQQRHGLAAGRLVARPSRGRSKARQRDHSAGPRPRRRMDDCVRWERAAQHAAVPRVPHRGSHWASPPGWSG